MKRIRGGVTWSCRGRLEERRWGKALCCEYASVFAGPASLSTSLLWARMLTGSTRVDGPAMLECRAALTSSCAPRVQIPAFGASMLLMFPAPLVPMLGANFQVELLACGLTLMFQLIQVFVTSSGHEYRALVAPWRTSVVSFPCRGVRFHLGGE